MQGEFRQGDVYIERIDTIPQGTAIVPHSNDRVVLATGEATGHHHSIASAGCELLERTDTGERFLRIMAASGVDLTHQEHSTITIPPGDYRVTIQREYVSADMAPLRVAD